MVAPPESEAIQVVPPADGRGEVAVERALTDPDRPEVGWTWTALWLDPPGQPPGSVPATGRRTRCSGVSGNRDSVLAALATMPATRTLIRAELVAGLTGNNWVPMPPLTEVRPD